MNDEEFKSAIREALLIVPIRRECAKLLAQGLVKTENPFWGHCAQATEVSYVLGRILYGNDFRFKAF
jgi:hypothetical protein